MIADGRDLQDGATLDYDICIVGSGPAGITAALQLAETDRRICLLEAGGREKSIAEQYEFYAGESVGLPYDVGRTRSRRFGGTSDRWAGYCALLDPSDFQTREWVPDSGWPIPYKEVFSYCRKAHRFMRMRPFDYDPRKWEGKGARRMPFKDGEVGDKIWHFNKLDFAKAFGKKLDQSTTIDVYLHSALTEFGMSEGADHVLSATVNTSRDKRFVVKAERFILACGAMENARLLLAQHQKTPSAFTNPNIGQCFMEHPHYFECAYFMFFNKYGRSKFYQGGLRLPRGSYRGVASLQVKNDIQQKNHFPNAVYRLNTRAGAAPFQKLILKTVGMLYPSEDRPHLMSRVVIMAEQYPNRASRITLSEKETPTTRRASGSTGA